MLFESAQEKMLTTILTGDVAVVAGVRILEKQMPIFTEHCGKANSIVQCKGRSSTLMPGGHNGSGFTSSPARFHPLQREIRRYHEQSRW